MPIGLQREQKKADSKLFLTLTQLRLMQLRTPSCALALTQFRAIAEIRRDAKVQVVGRDGDWVLIVSKKGNPPGYIEMASIEPSSGVEKQESSAPPVEGKYESLVDTRVYSGPGLHSVVARQRTKINVVERKRLVKVNPARQQAGYVEHEPAKRPVGSQ
jgi:hypothetical protein